MHRYHNVLTLLLYSLICLPLLATLSTANPIAQTPSAFFPNSQSPSSQNKWNPRSRGRTNLPLSGVKLDLHEKRIPPVPLFTDRRPIVLNMLKFTQVGVMTPIVAAAQAMQQFYYEVASKAAGEWNLSPELDRVLIQEGRLQLSFVCTGDTIPWKFVKDTAMTLYQAAALGFADLFEAIYMDDAGTIAVTVSVGIVDTVSSSDGSTPDYWREGSVPSVSFP